MREMEFTHEGRRYIRVSRRIAKKNFGTKDIYMCPCNLRPFGPWGIGCWMGKDAESFDKIVNNFEFYNCINEETGKYAAFYIAQ